MSERPSWRPASCTPYGTTAKRPSVFPGGRCDPCKSTELSWTRSAAEKPERQSVRCDITSAR